MAASAKTLTIDSNGDWTVVLPRRGRQRGKATKVKISEEKQETWAPTDSQIDPSRESKLKEKVERYIDKVGSSQFYRSFVDQIQTSVLDDLQRVLGLETKMQMVIYGIGSIELYEPPCLQISLAILMKREFSWIGSLEVFDPILSVTESQVLEAFGCSVISMNEHGKREALKPIMFFMPHCEAVLYNNLLQANWKPKHLSNMVILGNSFEEYEQHASLCKNSPVLNSVEHILAARSFTHEFKIETISNDFYNAFHDSSWHFFSSADDIELPCINS